MRSDRLTHYSHVLGELKLELALLLYKQNKISSGKLRAYLEVSV